MTLADDIDSDLSDVFMDTALGFAVNATTSGAATIPGIFQKDYFESDPGGGVNIESTTPVFRAETSTATGVTHGDTLTINAVVYEVVEIQPDESGITDFRLMES